MPKPLQHDMPWMDFKFYVLYVIYDQSSIREESEDQTLTIG